MGFEGLVVGYVSVLCSIFGGGKCPFDGVSVQEPASLSINDTRAWKAGDEHLVLRS